MQTSLTLSHTHTLHSLSHARARTHTLPFSREQSDASPAIRCSSGGLSFPPTPILAPGTKSELCRFFLPGFGKKVKSKSEPEPEPPRRVSRQLKKMWSAPKIGLRVAAAAAAAFGQHQKNIQSTKEKKGREKENRGDVCCASVATILCSLSLSLTHSHTLSFLHTLTHSFAVSCTHTHSLSLTLYVEHSPCGQSKSGKRSV